MRSEKDIKFHHLTISVNNLDESQEFYEKLGFHYSRDFERKDYPAKFRDLVLDNFCLRLIEFQDKEKLVLGRAENPLVNFQTIGLKHFALEVENLSSFLKNAQLDIIDEFGTKDREIQEGVSGVRYVFLKDLDGNIIEVVEQIR